MPDAICVEGLAKRYGTLRAVDGVSFTVPEGRVFAFLGPNGAGKTTTVEILEGLRNRSAGSVQVLGLDPWKDGPELHEQIGVIPQEFRFFDKIHPREAVVYYARLFGSTVDPLAILRRVYLEKKADARFDTLSGGQKQKLGLALSLVNNPRVLFLDEPTTGLDPQARRGIWEVIRALRAEGRTVFLTTHYLEEASLLADQVAIIHRGQIISSGTPEQIIAAHGRPDRLRFEAGPEVARYLSGKLPFAVTNEPPYVDVELRRKQDALQVLTVLEASQLGWDHLSVARDTLEDVFVRLVGRMDDGVIKSEAS
ncbi:MAG: ABC transporter ATP-binding protein [Thermoplasmata archaeon]|nr:ABC transporter ATP-binding protein [Thermoplasmata archaeon]MCI4337768.1 ABC transporter ATP-binding protein [Thermoplasmata archaeon]MCI4340854.1 ABC transporter ATP-binding protein [Thermoplasmata archaeon]